MDLRISLYKLNIFCRVAELTSVTKAAEELRLAQPVVTGHIRSLERRLQVKLLARAGRGVELTEAGAIAHHWARDLLSRTRETEAVLDAMSHKSDNTIHIVSSPAPATWVLPRVLIHFREAHPDAVVRLRVLRTDVGAGMVAAGECAFAIVTHAEDIHNRDGLDSLRLREEPQVLIAAPDHPPYGKAISVSELGSLAFICTPDGSPRRRVLDRRLRELGVASRDIVLEFADADAIMDAVRQGIGVAFLSQTTVAPEIAAGNLRQIEVPDAPLLFGVELLFRAGRKFTDLENALFDAVAEALREPVRISGVAPRHAESTA